MNPFAPVGVEAVMSGRREKEGDQQERRPRRDLTMPILLLVIAGLAIALAVVGTSGGGSSSGPAPPPTKARTEAAVKHLAADEGLANKVIDGSIDDQLAALRGVPVVVNQWASWCPNCREEFPFFQQLGRRFRGKVAFIGLDSQDDRAGAKDFLGRYPVSYPSIYDPSASQAASIGGGRGWPTTIFYDRRGERTYIRPGGYTSADTLRADIERYALAG
ncbi:MAG: TlpA family protein disulfide reductase [Actinobacteria bacterium]|nr:TlpA family protein disulfide reductase [Actinomycetota bacterium]